MADGAGFNDIEAAKIAINMERNGLSFYIQAAERVGPGAVRTVFEQLAEDERSHIAIFEDLHEKLRAEPQRTGYLDDEEIDIYMRRLVENHVFSDEGTVKRLLEQVDSDISALAVGMRAERDTMLFYQEMVNFAGSDAARDAFARIIDEERRHLSLLGERSEHCERLRG